MSRFKMNIKMLDWLIYQEEQARSRLGLSAHVDTHLPAAPFGDLENLDSGPILERVCDDSERTRQEALVLLGRIGEDAIVEGLVRQLECSSPSTRWSAVHQLTSRGRASVRPLFMALTRDFYSANLREGVRHILHSLNHQGVLKQNEAEVMHALDHHQAGIYVAQKANQSLIAVP